MSARRHVRVEELLGRRVRDANGNVVGRIEEIRVKRRDDGYEVSEYLMGPGALLERLGRGHRWFGRKRETLVARWDQLDIRRPDRPILTCDAEKLRRE